MLRPGEGVSEANLIARSGLVNFADVSSESIRAIQQMGGDLYAASKGRMWKITTAGVVTELGTIDDGPTTLASNGSEVGIVTNGKYYLCDGSTVTPVAISAMPEVYDITFMDGYFVLVGSTGTRNDAITISGLYDGLTFDAGDIAFSEADPDGAVAILRNGEDLWVFNESTYEIFYNSGNADFPFEPRGTGSGTYGCLSSVAVALSNDMPFWIRPDGAVMMGQGYVGQNISTPEIQELIADSTVEGMSVFTDRSHDIVAIT
jgi:Phage stabilisation protein.